MNFSYCQNQFSCFSCCGLTNFNLSYSQIVQILIVRTKEFQSLPEIKRELLLRYRWQREHKEKFFPRYDKEIYICPFLGFIKEDKIGCMIHPTITNESSLQDVSFYKSRICLEYNCYVKDQDNDRLYFDFITKVVSSKFSKKNLKKFFKGEEPIPEKFYQTFLYSRLIADSILYKFIVHYFDLQQLNKNQRLYFFLFYIVCFRLQQKFFVSSFEINYLNFSLQSFEDNLKMLLPELENKKNFIKKYKMFLKQNYVNPDSSSES